MNEKLIHMADRYSGFTTGGALAGFTTTCAPEANRAYFIPFYLPDTFTVTSLIYGNGAAPSGNVDLGIYDEDGVRLVSSGSTAKPGVGGPRAIDVTDTVLTAGRYYWGYAQSNTAAVFGWTHSALIVNIMSGALQQASAFPLPATATFAAPSHQAMPFVGATNGTRIWGF